jgi:exopolysaccharide production protein ExoQ
MLKTKKLSDFIDVLIIVVSYLVTNSTSFAFIWQFPDFSDISEVVWSLAGVSGCVLLLVLFQIKILSLENGIKRAWRSQIPLLLFVIYSICSLFWSSYFLASVYELLQMIFATLFGIYIVVRFKPETVFNIIVFYGVFSVLASVLLLIFNPQLARIDNPFFQGAWRGIYWHRNHMGSMVAFFSSILFLKIAMNRNHLVQSITFFVFFIMSTVLVFGSRSATGILIYFILIGMLIIGFLWLRFHTLLKRKHYLGIAALAGLVVVLVLVNIDRIFGLLGRNSSLTGRVPLWIDLLTRVWIQKPIFGFGFGALWNQEAFRLALTSHQNWDYMIYFADNGFLDILLNTGLIGLILFLIFFVITGKRSISAFVSSRSLISLVPLLLFAYIFLANLSYSFFFEVDQFVWMLLIFSAILSFRIHDSNTVPNSSISKPQP